VIIFVENRDGINTIVCSRLQISVVENVPVAFEQKFPCNVHFVGRATRRVSKNDKKKGMTSV
jgi:hypothetical protein